MKSVHACGFQCQNKEVHCFMYTRAQTAGQWYESFKKRITLPSQQSEQPHEFPRMRGSVCIFCAILNKLSRFATSHAHAQMQSCQPPKF